MEQLENMCRACAMEIETESDLSIISEFKDETPINILQYIFPDLQLGATMAREYKLCSECLGKLLDCKHFKQMIVETEKQLKRYLNELKMTLTADNIGKKKTFSKVTDEINYIQCSDSLAGPAPKKYSNNHKPTLNTMETFKISSHTQPLLSVTSAVKSNSVMSSQAPIMFENVLIKQEFDCDESINYGYQVEKKVSKEMLIDENVFTDANKTTMSPYEKLRAKYVTEKTSFAECNVLVVLDPVVKCTFACHECGKIFPKKRLLAEHLIFHEKVRRGAADLYECETCNKTFDNFRDFKLNENNCIMELRKSRYQCRYCDQWLRSHDSFKLHETKCFENQVERPKNPYLCSFCGKTYDFYFACWNHEWRHKHFGKKRCKMLTKEIDSDRHMSCTECDQLLDSKEQLEDHMYQLHGVKMHECKICKKRFVRREALATHLKNVHSGLEFVCEYCGKKYKTRAFVQVHIEKVHKTGEKLKKYKCQQCDQEFKTPMQRKCHRIRVHEPEKLLQCEHCPNRQPVQCLLTRHVNAVHKKTKQLHLCKICGQSFSQRCSVTRHMKIHLAENLQRSCQHCGETFADGILYRVHLRQLHKDKFVRCTLCATTCANKGYLSQHMSTKHRMVGGVDRRRRRTQKDKPPFPCSDCDRTFNLKTSLSRHEQTAHIRKTPYSCNLCGKFFNTALALKYHRVVHTGEKPYPCKVCNKRFTQPSSVTKHNKVCHPNL